DNAEPLVEFARTVPTLRDCAPPCRETASPEVRGRRSPSHARGAALLRQAGQYALEVMESKQAYSNNRQRLCVSPPQPIHWCSALSSAQRRLRGQRLRPVREPPCR